MLVTGVINRLSQYIDEAANSAIRSLQEGAIDTEPSLTDRFLGALEVIIGRNGIDINGYRFKMRTLRDRGRNAPEHEFGADFVSVFDVNIPDYKISKGFLAQAKLAGKEEITILEEDYRRYPEIYIRIPAKSSTSRLVSQCQQMLSISPESYVFVYSARGIFVVPASTVVSIAPSNKPHRIYTKEIGRFFKDYMMSFVGDLSINAFDDETLRVCRETTRAKSAMLLEMRLGKDKRL